MFAEWMESLKLFLPALIPSWRFFDEVRPSPRIEYAVMDHTDQSVGLWQELRPHPARLPFGSMLGRIFYNPRWNESLFIVSCAERWVANQSPHNLRMIEQIIRADLKRDSGYFQFRISFISRNGDNLQTEIAYTSGVYPCT